MEFLIVLLIVVLGGLVVGTPVYLLREIRRGAAALPAALPDLGPLRAELEARHQTETERLRAEAKGAVGELDAELGRLREGLRTTSHEHERQLALLRERYAAVDDQTGKLLDQGIRDLRSHLDGELGRLRDGVGAAMASIARRQESPDAVWLATRRAEAIAELYRRLAKLESAVVAVANPILLPGEGYTLPPELLPETLRWENWKEVGDAAFAFADAFNQGRLYLDDATCRDLAAFVTRLRELLTRSIYPYLRGNPTAEGLATLREALEQLGGDVPAARDRLERAFREIADRG